VSLCASCGRFILESSAILGGQTHSKNESLLFPHTPVIKEALCSRHDRKRRSFWPLL